MKFKSPSYTAVILVLPTLRADVVNVATPPFIAACPTGSNTTISPSGGGPFLEVTVAVKVTAWPWTDGFSDETQVVVVVEACGFTSNTDPSPLEPPPKVVP